MIGGIRREVVRAQRQESDRSAPGSGEAAVSFAAGDNVRHRTFGDGVVLESEGRTVTVMFGSVGKKRLAADLAPIEKV
jgi:hypothetical protein